MCSSDLAFIAAQLKGVLQASLTVFGVVGGPLLGLFSLGLFCPFVSEMAAIPGFVVSLTLGLWMGFGGPKPSTRRLVYDISDCVAFPMASASNTTTPHFTERIESTSQAEEVQYFYLYKISYQWYTLIGFIVVRLVKF